jgi:hypothetical protein
VFGFQDLATRLPDTRNLTPETYITYQRACCPAEATFSERSLGKSLGPLKILRGMLRRGLFAGVASRIQMAQGARIQGKARMVFSLGRLNP